MQSHGEQEALVPRPRGNLPKVCAVALATMAIAVLLLQSPERSCGLVVMVILILTLGPLLHGVCLLGEEILHHINTRYGGQWGRAPSACGIGSRTLLPVGLAGCLWFMTVEHQSEESACWSLLLLASAVYPLFRTLGVLGLPEVEVSEICEGGKMNVAHGLAWSFYLGYLQLVLPRLRDSIAVFRASHQTSPFQVRGSQKLLILIPLNANITHKLEHEDDNIRFYDNLPNTEMDRAGVRGRVYKHSVYSVLDENGKAHECVVEYATPLLTLYSMSQDRSAGFGESERRQQVLLFYRTLQDILERSLECRNQYRLILLDDEHEEDPHFLSKVILRHLQQQEKEEFCVTPPPQQESEHPFNTVPCAPHQNVDWRNAEMSREPTLMFSLERPQPLREAVENTDY
ncbi:stimulator of interferon genes protein isoform 1-T2 [Polymixia lowei]